MPLELFTNEASTTVSSGGTGAPAQGTVETWTVASSASFPAASSVAVPPSQFHVADPAAVTEIIAVTNVSGTSWTVTRGAESSTPVTHNAGFTVQQVITAAALNAFIQVPRYQFWVDSYGAKGDGKVIGDAAITSGTAVLTSASASFTTADVGKAIMVNGAAGTTSTPLITTILSRQSATQVTLNANATATVTGGTAFYATDDTAAINSAVTAASNYAQGATGNFYAQVIFGSKFYGLASGPTQTGNGTTTPTFNSQIPLPYPNANGTTQKLVLELVGASDAAQVQYWQSTIPNMQGTCLVSMILAPVSGGSGTFGLQSVIGGPSAGNNSGAFGFTGGFANVKPTVENMMIVTPAFAQQTDLDFRFTGGCRVSRSSSQPLTSVLGNAPALSTSYATQLNTANFNNSIGLYAPIPLNNDDVYVGTYTVEGKAFAYAIGEHFTAGRINALYCNIGVFVRPGGGAPTHGASILYYNCEASNVALQASTASSNQFPLFIGLMDAEVISTWDVQDFNSLLSGTVYWSDFERTTMNVQGAGQLKIVNTRLGPGAWGGQPAVPASTVAQQNTSWRDAAVSVKGGTLTVIAVDGVTVSTVTNTTVIVPAGKNITLTYTVAPTWAWTLL